MTVVQRDNSFSSFFCVTIFSFGVESNALRNMSSLAPIVLLAAFVVCNRFMVAVVRLASVRLRILIGILKSVLKGRDWKLSPLSCLCHLITRSCCEIG